MRLRNRLRARFVNICIVQRRCFIRRDNRPSRLRAPKRHCSQQKRFNTGSKSSADAPRHMLPRQRFDAAHDHLTPARHTTTTL